MANNRLYIGDMSTKEYIFLEKGWGSGWDGDWFNADLFKEFIRDRYEEAEVGTKTSLVFFTEYDNIHDWFITHGTKYEL